MKTIVRNSVLVAAFMAVCSVSCAHAQENSGGGRLAGAWDATVTIINCATGVPITSFASFATFNQGGTFSGITSGTPPARRSPELGVWSHLQGNQYVFRFKAFIFDPAGVPTGYQIVTHELELDKDNVSYTSAGGVQIFDMAGTQAGSGCSTGVGTRMQL